MIEGRVETAIGGRLTILFSGMIAADPWQGGATWAVLQHLLGLRRLGHEVFFIEPMPAASLRPEGAALAASENARYFQRVIAEFRLQESSALLVAGTRESFGAPYDALLHAARRADLLINVSGMLADEALLAAIPVRVYLDLDPGFVQLWQAVQGIDMRFAGHTHFVTVGQNIGRPGCAVPTCGLPWMPTAQPVVLAEWPAVGPGAIAHDALTTVGNWRGYGSIEHQGVHYGQKAHSLRMLMELPARTGERFMPALAIHPDETTDLAALARHGWRLLDPREVSATPGDYRQFVQGSKAEFGVAKSGYVASACGWFSDRSACYLASARPVIAQQTGFDRWLPTGEGLVAFTGVEDAAEAVRAVSADYARHCRAARALAEEFFDSDKVLGRLLRAVGVAP